MNDQHFVLNPIRILIVDDHPNTASMLARVLSKLDQPVEVITASSGEDALEKIGDQVMDILITDFMMPGLNGLELIEKLRGEKKPAHTILITAYDTPGLAITARRLNIQDYLVKPVQPDKIRSIVSRVIGELRPNETVNGAPVRRVFKILIADDYPDNLRLLSTRLRNEGYEFIPAWDGEETLQKVREDEPDLVLLDVNMPKKDGFQVLAEMRSDPEISHIPVIIITAARIGSKDVREGLTLGADDYITKPFDWRELAARIQSKLRVKQAEDALRRRTRDLGILPEIGQELSARLDIEELADIVVSRTVEALGVDSARLDVFQPDGEVYCRKRRADARESRRMYTSREQVFKNTLIAHVVEKREGLVVGDVNAEEHWRMGALEGAISAVAVPLLGQREIIGVLMLAHSHPCFFNRDHQALLQAIASQAAIAIENAQLLHIEHKRVQELIALNNLAREINQFTYSTQLLDRLPRLIQDALGYPVVALWNGADLIGNDDFKLTSMVGAAKGIDPDLLVSIPYEVANETEPGLLRGDSGGPSAVAVHLSSNGRVRGVLAAYSPLANIFTESDRVLLQMLATQIVAALERISLFESVEQEQRRLLAVLRSAADAILVMDSQMRLTLANPAGERLFAETDACVGEALPKCRGYEPFVELLDCVRISDMHQQGEIQWPDGRVFSVLVTPIEEGGQVAVLHDITQFKKLAELKNEYIATASHDLKNPIQAVLGYNDLLTKAGELNEMQKDFSQRIRGAAEQMRDLVLNLLEISRLESGAAMQQDVLNLHTLLNEAAEEVSDQVQAKGHTLSIDFCDSQPNVCGDKTLLQQMVRNLLGNAIKYTPRGGQILLATELEDSKVFIDFKDSGVGIPEQDLPHIFNKFFRSQTAATKDIEGTGLGLAIVRSIVDNHNGAIDVESIVGQGSNFRIMLPVFDRNKFCEGML
jgi:two-component system phosphate regulon sensor histidine kinase PhoR